ncbi:sodium:proton antiporter [Parazoarcus communis]|uniref:Sodium:proton antiporter n=1 Tax=Parazoarcus communis TaxID=41977 RepID=A0A2U8GTD7_9RHOO|nr:cation:proton antiporter [Parazoarcus communis]AWI76513.1 sodium:proton antiporter [Parazoarcus communis]
MSTAANALNAAGVHKTEALLFFTLMQLAVIILVARAGGEIALRLGQSSVVGEIVTGILLGPSLFGWLAPGLFDIVFRSAPPEPMQILSQIGLLLLMFQIGLEFDFSHLTERKHRHTVAWVASAGLTLPFALGFALGWLATPLQPAGADPLVSGLFVATAFSITALPILGRIMIEFQLTRSPLGVIAISAAAINDVVGWLLLALVSTLAAAQLDALDFLTRIVLVLVFFGLSWFVVRPLVKRLVHRARPGRGRLPPNLMGFLLALIFGAGMCTYQLGIFAIFGGFLMGVILHDEHGLREAWNTRVGHFVSVFFLPVFFTYTGLRTDIGSLDSLADWGWCALVIALATLGKFGGSYLAARRCGLVHGEAGILGIMMNTRALMELVVINVGYDLGVISQTMFTMLVIMAIFSTILTTPCLRIWLPAIGHPLPPRVRE